MGEQILKNNGKVWNNREEKTHDKIIGIVEK